MRFTVDKDWLASKLHLASRVVGTGTALKDNPSLAGIHVAIREDIRRSARGRLVAIRDSFSTCAQKEELERLNILCSDGRKFLQTSVTAVNADGKGAHLIEGISLINIVKKLDEGNLRFSFRRGHVEIRGCDEQTYPIRTLNKLSFPRIGQWLKGGISHGVVDARRLSAALRFLNPFIRKVSLDSLYGFTEYEPSKRAFLATTGTVLAKYQVPLELGKPLKIWGHAIPSLLAFLNGYESVEIFEAADVIWFETGDDIFGFEKVKIDFRKPKVNPTIFNEPEVFSVNIRHLRSMLGRLGIVIDTNKDKCVRLAISGKGSDARLSGRVTTVTGSESSGGSIPIRRFESSAPSLEVPVTFSEMKLALRSFDTARVDVFVMPGKWIKLASMRPTGEFSVVMVA